MQVLFENQSYSPVMADHVFHLRKIREASGLSIRELARQLNQQPTNISFWERTHKLPKPEVLIPMAKALGVSVEELLGEPKPRRTQTPGGRLGQTFDNLGKLPRRKQAKILDVVEALLAQEEAQAS